MKPALLAVLIMAVAASGLSATELTPEQKERAREAAKKLKKSDQVSPATRMLKEKQEREKPTVEEQIAALKDCDAEVLRAIAAKLLRKVDKLEMELAEADKRIAAMEGQQERLKGRAEQAERDKARTARRKHLRALAARRAAADNEADPDGSIRAAVKAKKLTVGMTVEQANEALGEKGREVGQSSDGSIQMEWKKYRQEVIRVTTYGRPVTRPVLGTTYLANVRDGKIVSYTKF